MALLFMDGFDATDIAQKWSTINGSWFADVATRFSSGNSSRIGSPNGVTRFLPAANQLYVGVAIKPGAADASTGIIRLLGDSATTIQLNLRLSSVNQITLYTGNTLLGTYTHGSQLTNLWNYFEIGGTIATSGGTATVRMNGTTVISFTGNTKGGGTATTFDAVALWGNSYSGTSFDDFYVCDSTGSAPHNTFLGDVRIATITPNGAGSSTQFTPSSGANYTTVDELPYSASDYVSASASGTRDTYAMSDVSGSYSVLAVQNNVIAKKTDAGGTALKPAIKSGASVYYGASATLTSNDTTFTDLRTTDPATSAAWTISGVNAIEAGMEIA